MTDGRLTPEEQITRAVRGINEAWLAKRPKDVEEFLHADVVMVFPGFAGRSEGSAAMVAGFEDFCKNADVHEFEESDLQVDVAGDAAVASFAFEVTCERDGKTYRSTGRDLWVFTRDERGWLATWRTMLDVTEEPVE